MAVGIPVGAAAGAAGVLSRIVTEDGRSGVPAVMDPFGAGAKSAAEITDSLAVITEGPGAV